MKKNQTRILLIVLIFLIFVITTSTAQTGILNSMDFEGDPIELTLDQAIEIMLKDNPSIEKANLEFEQAVVEYNKNKSALKKAKAAFGDKKETSVDYLQNIKLLELTTEFKMDSAKRNLKTTVQNLKVDIEQSYFNLLQAEKARDINKENFEIASNTYNITKKKFELGLVGRQELLNSELSYIKAKNDYQSADNNVTNAKMAFNVKIGNDVMRAITLKDELEYRNFEPVSISDAISNALINRNEIKAAEFAYEVEKVNMQIIEKLHPEITYAFKEQKLKLEKAAKDLENIKKNIEVEVRSNYLEIMQKQEEIKSGEKSIEIAEQALKLSRLSYEIGSGLLVDVEKAQVNYLQAKLALSRAIVDYNLAILKFENSLGIEK
jgi:outer membrane protein TolC